MKLIFLDIDGVIRNYHSIMNGSSLPKKADPRCVAALNKITDQTDAQIVVTSTWREAGLEQITADLRSWGISGKILSVTPELRATYTEDDGSLFLVMTRGDEIQSWLDENAGLLIESFVILDDDTDMKHLLPRLIKTSFQIGLTQEHVDRAIQMLSEGKGL